MSELNFIKYNINDESDITEDLVIRLKNIGFEIISESKQTMKNANTTINPLDTSPGRFNNTKHDDGDGEGVKLPNIYKTDRKANKSV